MVAPSKALLTEWGYCNEAVLREMARLIKKQNNKEKKK